MKTIRFVLYLLERLRFHIWTVIGFTYQMGCAGLIGLMMVYFIFSTCMPSSYDRLKRRIYRDMGVPQEEYYTPGQEPYLDRQLDDNLIQEPSYFDSELD